MAALYALPSQQPQRNLGYSEMLLFLNGPRSICYGNTVAKLRLTRLLFKHQGSANLQHYPPD